MLTVNPGARARRRARDPFAAAFGQVPAERDHQRGAGTGDGGEMSDLEDCRPRNAHAGALRDQPLDGVMQIAFEKQRPGCAPIARRGRKERAVAEAHERRRPVPDFGTVPCTVDRLDERLRQRPGGGTSPMKPQFAAVYAHGSRARFGGAFGRADMTRRRYDHDANPG
jgi:hypothetical protein